jgi:hypothetical protein
MRLDRRLDRLERELDRPDGVVATIAADFLCGGEATFARIFDRRGFKLTTIRRLTDEPWAAFVARAKGAAGEIPGACSMLIGGLPEDGIDVERNLSVSAEPPRGAIDLPEAGLHPSQVQALALVHQHRRVALVCGRRWGKSCLLVALAVDAALSGKRVGIFAPTRTLLSPLLHAIAHALCGVRGAGINRMFGEIRLPNGGHVDFWSIDHTQRAGRGRAYHLALIDEAGHDETYLTDAFQVAIAPTLLDYAGSIVEASTPNGVSPENHFWRIAHMSEMGFVVHHAPTSANPHLPVEEIAALRATMRPEEAAQELDALFVDMAGLSIFPLAALLENGQPVADNASIDTIGVAIDSAAGETGFEHDGTAALVYGLRQPRNILQQGAAGFEVVLLDWDVRSLALGAAGAWLRHINDLYRAWIQRLRPRMGSDGFHIEKPAMGLRLLELAGDQRIPATALPTDWVELGKDGRALMAEPHIREGRVKLAKAAYDKRMEFKGAVHNHLVSQLTGFRLFDRKSGKRADDLCDAAIYAVLRCLGDGRTGRWDRLRRAASRAAPTMIEPTR